MDAKYGWMEGQTEGWIYRIMFAVLAPTYIDLGPTHIDIRTSCESCFFSRFRNLFPPFGLGAEKCVILTCEV